MGSKVDAKGLELPVFGFGIGPIQRQDDFPGATHHRRDQVAAGDLEIDSHVTQKSIDAFYRVFCGGVPRHRHTASHGGDAQDGIWHECPRQGRDRRPLRFSQRPVRCQPRRNG